MKTAYTASVTVVQIPRLLIARLLDLRAFLDSVLACGLGNEILGGEADDQALVGCTMGSVRGAAAEHPPRQYRAGQGRRAVASAAGGSDGGPGRSAGNGR